MKLVKVTVVSTREPVSPAAATVLVAFALTRVPLGLPALSVSIRTHRSTDGLPTLARLSLRVVPATPLPKTGKETRVLFVTSPILCAEVACAVVGAGSINTTSQIERVSQAGYEVFGVYSWSQSRVSALSTNLLLAETAVPLVPASSLTIALGSALAA